MATSTQRRATRRPNIVLVTTDDQGTQAGCYGDPYAITPNLDRFARQGVRFSRGYVSSASCSPSRSSMLTGLYPHQNGQLGLSHLGYTMLDHIPTLPAVLMEEGYQTGIIGKLHVEPEENIPFPFDHSDKVWETRNKHFVARKFREFLGQSAGRPFFFMCNLFDPHPPYHTEPPIGLPDPPYEPGAIPPFPWLGIDNPAIREEMASIYNLTTRADSCFGALLEVLEQEQLARDTLVIYLGDNGPNFARGKATCYEAGVHVPFVMRWPDGIPDKTVHHGFVSAVDIVPTVCDAVGIPWPGEVAGGSLLPAARGESLPRRRFAFTEYNSHTPENWFPRRSIRGTRYKLIDNLLHNRYNPIPWLGAERGALAPGDSPYRRKLDTHLRPPPIELYDLATDPHEWVNLANNPAHASVRRFLEDALLDWRQRTGDILLDRDLLAELTAAHDETREAMRMQRMREQESG